MNRSKCKGIVISVVPDEINAWRGDSIVFNYSISSNVDLVRLTVTPDKNILESKTITKFTQRYYSSDSVNYVLPMTNIYDGEIIMIFFRIVDKDGEECADQTYAKINIIEPN